MQRTAEPGECNDIARALDLLACALSLDYVIVPSGSGRYRLTGTLKARVEQACGVTLEPVASTIEEHLDLRFWPAADIPAPTSGEVDLNGEEDPEPIVEDRIGVGRVARAAPDGYTLDIGQWDTHVANGATFPLSYDVVKDFEPVALLLGSKRESLENGEQIFFAGQLAKNRGFLREIADAAAGPEVHG